MGTKTDTPEDTNGKQDVEANELEQLAIDEPVVKAVNPREAMMQSVVNDSVETRNQAYIDEGMEPPSAGAVVVEELEIDEPAPETITQAPELELEIVDKQSNSADTAIVQRDGQSFIKVRIDGVDQEVPVGDMVTHYQKNENANTKLGLANQMLNQARALQQSQASTQPDDSQSPVVDENAVNAVFNKLYDGDVDEAAKEFSTLMSQQSAPQVDISTQVAQEVARLSDHNNLTSSFAKFQKNEDFKHIVNDPTLMSKVDGFTVELQQDSAFMATNPSYEDIFNEAGKRTGEWLQGIAPPTATEQIIESRRERKLSKPQSVNSRTARRGPAPEKKVATREDNIAKMAKARGQTIYN